MNAKAAVEETQDGVNSAEEIIELQDLRMSPIPSLRNRHKSKYYKEPGGILFSRITPKPDTFYSKLAFLFMLRHLSIYVGAPVKPE